MILPSYIGLNLPSFAPDDIRVRFHESPQHGDAYIVDLGAGAYLRMRPADLRDLIAKLTAAMAERGDLPDEAAVEDAKAAADADARAAAAAAEARQWAKLHRHPVKAVAR